MRYSAWGRCFSLSPSAGERVVGGGLYLAYPADLSITTEPSAEFLARSKRAHSYIRRRSPRRLFHFGYGRVFQVEHLNDDPVFLVERRENSVEPFPRGQGLTRLHRFQGCAVVLDGRLLFFRQIGHSPFGSGSLRPEGVQAIVHGYPRNPVIERRFATVLIEFLEYFHKDLLDQVFFGRAAG